MKRSSSFPRFGFAAATLLWLAAAGGGGIAQAQDTNPDSKDDDSGGGKAKGLRFVWKRHPSIRAGDWLRVDFRARLQMDWTVLNPETSASPDIFDFERRRFAVEGVLFKRLEFEISRETAETDFAWKDVYGNIRIARGLQVRGGRFRIPFSLEQTTGPTDLDFIERSRIAARLAPGRDTGVVVHGNILKRGLRYQGGVFGNDGDIAATTSNLRTGQRTVAGRLVAQPFRWLPVPKLLEDFSIGGAATTSDVPAGLYGIRGRTAASDTTFPAYFVSGNRRRVGLEMNWMPGPFSVKGELIDLREQRLKQSIRGEDLPDMIQRGWYLTGTWVVTGQRKSRGLDRGRYVPFIKRWGAVEVAARYEAIRLASDTATGIASRSTRAFNATRQSDRLWTFGVNWFLTQWVKLQANVIRDRIEDSFRAPVQGVPSYWIYKFRMQFTL